MTLRLPLILASHSTRRQELLRAAGVDFTVVGATDVTESHDPALSPAELTTLNARAKAQAVASGHPAALVLGADTLVYLDGVPLGKPASLAGAAEMLGRLSGRAHHVCTGVCLSWAGGSKRSEFHDLTTVVFRRLSAAVIGEYLDKVHVLDKAGGYALQDHADLIVDSIEGSWSNVVGLPVEETLAALVPWRQG